MNVRWYRKLETKISGKLFFVDVSILDILVFFTTDENFVHTREKCEKVDEAKTKNPKDRKNPYRS